MNEPISRRNLLAGAIALGGARLRPPQRVAAPGPLGRLIANERGGYLYVPGVPFLSFGAVAADGFEIVRATFRQPPAFPEGFGAVERHLRAAGRPVQALCGFEMRNGRQATVPEFMAFNDRYIATLRTAGVFAGERMPLVRSNLVLSGVESAHTIHAFTYTRPAASRASRPTFVVAGMPDVRLVDLVVAGKYVGSNTGPQVVAPGDVSPAGLRQKTMFVLDTIDAVLGTMSAGWRDVTGIQLYTVEDLHPLLADVIYPRLGEAARHGIQWHHVRLPVASGDVEIDVRSVSAELTIDG